MHLRQFSRVRKTRKISDAEFHTLMGWIKMYYFRGLIDSINFAYNFKTHFPARQYIFNPTFYNFLCTWSEVSDIPFYRFLHTKKPAR